MWRYLRGNWPEPLDLFLKGTVRYCTVLVIVVAGRLGVSLVYVRLPPVRRLSHSGPPRHGVRSFARGFKRRFPVSLCVRITDHLLMRSTLAY